MDNEQQLIELLNQHTQILINIERIYLILVAFAFFLLLLILAMVFAAVWSVRSVNKRQTQTESQWKEMSMKWDGLLNLLVANARQRN